MGNSRDAANIADWRLRVFELYARVRELATDDPAAAHSLWRDERDELFRSHPSSPLLPEHRATFTRLAVADYDPAWRFEVAVEPAAESRRLDVATGTDGVVPFELLGTARIPDVGVARRVAPGQLRRRDLPAGARRAGRKARRHLWRRALPARHRQGCLSGAAPGDDGAGELRLILDFNFAYNPSCAYDPAWACPLPQAGNRLSAPVPVGELAFEPGGIPSPI